METKPLSDGIQSIDLSTLTPIVRKALDCETFAIDAWQVNPLGGGVGNPVSQGLYRFNGTGQDQDRKFSWSLILKIVHLPKNDKGKNRPEWDEKNWNYWKREPLIYTSGLLDGLPGGIAAPTCLGSGERPGDIIWLWFEEIIDSYAGAWTLERYALAARHFGQLNGFFLSEGKLPSYPWLSRHRLQQWIEMIPWRKLPWGHPFVLAHYAGVEMNSFRRLLVENERFLAKLDLLPQTLCHGDTYPTNIMSKDLPDGRQKTIALDWGLAGIDPVGADLGQLVLGAQDKLKDPDPLEIVDLMFASYIAGLGDSGCKLNPSHVRFGFAAYAALQVGLFKVFLLGEALEQNKTTTDQALNKFRIPFEVLMANEAYKTLDKI